MVFVTTLGELLSKNILTFGYTSIYKYVVVYEFPKRNARYFRRTNAMACSVTLLLKSMAPSTNTGPWARKQTNCFVLHYPSCVEPDHNIEVFGPYGYVQFHLLISLVVAIHHPVASHYTIAA